MNQQALGRILLFGCLILAAAPARADIVDLPSRGGMVWFGLASKTVLVFDDLFTGAVILYYFSDEGMSGRGTPDLLTASSCLFPNHVPDCATNVPYPVTWRGGLGVTYGYPNNRRWAVWWLANIRSIDFGYYGSQTNLTAVYFAQIVPNAGGGIAPGLPPVIGSNQQGSRWQSDAFDRAAAIAPMRSSAVADDLLSSRYHVAHWAERFPARTATMPDGVGSRRLALSYPFRAYWAARKQGEPALSVPIAY
jgi:hypothetical protein